MIVPRVDFGEFLLQIMLGPSVGVWLDRILALLFCYDRCACFRRKASHKVGAVRGKGEGG